MISFLFSLRFFRPFASSPIYRHLQVNARDVEQLWKDTFTYLYRCVVHPSLSISIVLILIVILTPTFDSTGRKRISFFRSRFIRMLAGEWT